MTAHAVCRSAVLVGVFFASCDDLFGRAYPASTFEVERVDPGSFCYLRLPFELQDSALCVPTSALMVIRYYGGDADQRLLAAMSSAGSEAGSGTSFRDLIAAVRRLGFVWSLQATSTDAEPFEASFQRLKMQLEQKRPPIVSLRSSSMGHAVVLVGYDEDAGVVFLQDPASDARKPFPGAWILSYKFFDRSWQHRGRRYWVATQPSATSKTRAPRYAGTVEEDSAVLARLRALELQLDARPLPELLQSEQIPFESFDLLRPDQRSDPKAARTFVQRYLVDAVASLKRRNRIGLIHGSSGLLILLGGDERQDLADLLKWSSAEGTRAKRSRVSGHQLAREIVGKGSPPDPLVLVTLDPADLAEAALVPSAAGSSH